MCVCVCARGDHCTWRGQQVVDVDGFRAVGTFEQLLLQLFSQGRVGLDALFQLQPQVSDLRKQLAEIPRAGGSRILGSLSGSCEQ